MKLAMVSHVKKFLLVAFVVCFALAITVAGCSGSQRSSSAFDMTEDFTDIEWPNTALAQMLPEPESKYGEIVIDSEKQLSIEIGKTDKAAYDSYVKACMDKGFTVDYSKSSTYFVADNSEAYSLDLMYFEDDEYMSISLSAPKDEAAEASSNVEPTENASAPEMQADASASSVGDTPVDGIRPSFKEAMDSYEAFFAEYCDFMQKYNSEGQPLSMLADYTKLMAQYAETMDAAENLDDGNLSPEEEQYYLDAMGRINTMLANAATSMG